MKKYLLARFIYGFVCVLFLSAAALELFFALAAKKITWWLGVILASIGIVSGFRWWHWSRMAENEKKGGV